MKLVLTPEEAKVILLASVNQDFCTNFNVVTIETQYGYELRAVTFEVIEPKDTEELP